MVGSEASAAAVRVKAGIADSASSRPRAVSAKRFSAMVRASAIRLADPPVDVFPGRGVGGPFLWLLLGRLLPRLMSIGVRLSAAVKTFSSVSAGDWSVG